MQFSRVFENDSVQPAIDSETETRQMVVNARKVQQNKHAQKQIEPKRAVVFKTYAFLHGQVERLAGEAHNQNRQIKADHFLEPYPRLEP